MKLKDINHELRPTDAMKAKNGFCTAGALMCVIVSAGIMISCVADQGAIPSYLYMRIVIPGTVVLFVISLCVFVLSWTKGNYIDHIDINRDKINNALEDQSVYDELINERLIKIEDQHIKDNLRNQDNNARGFEE